MALMDPYEFVKHQNAQADRLNNLNRF